MIIKAEEVFKEYARMKLEVRKMEEEMERLNPIIVDYMIGAKIEKQPTNLGSFSLGKRKNWVFSPAVETVKKKLEDLKTSEQQDGTASFSEKVYLLFTLPTEEKNERGK